MEPNADAVSPGATAFQGSSLPLSEGEPALDRRREPRYATDQITFLYPSDQTGSQRMFCRILDISDSGMRVRTDQCLDAGTEVRITLREMCGIAKVRYCTAVGKAFDHGLQFEAVQGTDGTRTAPALRLLV